MASKPIYQIYAELEDYEPKIWRRFQVMNWNYWPICDKSGMKKLLMVILIYSNEGANKIW